VLLLLLNVFFLLLFLLLISVIFVEKANNGKGALMSSQGFKAYASI